MCFLKSYRILPIFIILFLAACASVDEAAVEQVAATVAKLADVKEFTAPTGQTLHFPIPADAQAIAFDQDSTEIGYTSPSNINILILFYRYAFAQRRWEEDIDYAVVGDTLSTLRFTKSGSQLYVNLTNDGSGTAVILDLSSVRLWISDDQVIAVVDNYSDSLTTEYTITDWPIPTEAKNVNVEGETLTFTTPWNMQQINDFYRPTFEKMGLSTFCTDNVSNEKLNSCTLDEELLNIYYLIRHSNLDKDAEVEITVQNLALPAPVTDADLYPDGSK